MMWTKILEAQKYTKAMSLMWNFDGMYGNWKDFRAAQYILIIHSHRQPFSKVDERE